MIVKVVLKPWYAPTSFPSPVTVNAKSTPSFPPPFGVPAQVHPSAWITSLLVSGLLSSQVSPAFKGVKEAKTSRHEAHVPAAQPAIPKVLSDWLLAPGPKTKSLPEAFSSIVYAMSPSSITVPEKLV